MKKQLIKFDQLAALSFWKFVKLDSVDMTLLMKGMSDIANVEVKDDTSDYFIMADGTIILNKNYIERFKKNVDGELFENILVSPVKKYLDSIDMFEFVLRKIKLLGPGCVVKDEISNNFSSLQVRIIKLLYQEGYIMEYTHHDYEYGDYQAIKLTQVGELYLYLIDNSKAIGDFCKLLKLHGYDESLIDMFLVNQDLKKNPNEILILNKFIHFCEEMNRESSSLIETTRSYKRGRVYKSIQ